MKIPWKATNAVNQSPPYSGQESQVLNISQHTAGGSISFVIKNVGSATSSLSDLVELLNVSAPSSSENGNNDFSTYHIRPRWRLVNLQKAL